jgi:hypothetical protein
MPIIRLPDGRITTGVHPLRERFRNYITTGEAWDEDTTAWKTYAEIALDLDPSGHLSHGTVCKWCWLDFPLIAERKMRQYRITKKGYQL